MGLGAGLGQGGGLRLPGCLALKTDGTLWGWGNNHLGQTGHGAFTPTLIGGTYSKVFAGSLSSFGVKSDNTTWGWGDNQSHALLIQTGLKQPQGTY